MFVFYVLASVLLPFVAADESETLLLFKGSLKDPNGTLKSWDESRSLCDWEGVSCSVKNSSMVQGLRLQYLSLSASRLAFTVDSLPHLKELHVSQSIFTDGIDTSFSSFQSGTLESLDISNNRLTGNLPRLTGCGHLKLVNLSYNQLDGELSSGFVNSTMLDTMDLSHNMLHGEIPIDFFSEQACKSLRVLNLSSNQLSGMVPKTVNCTVLEDVSLSHNTLEGSFVSHVDSRIKSLELTSNSFSQVKIHGCSRLERLELAFNKISGGVLHEEACTSLKLLNISSNLFSGDIWSTLNSTGDRFPSLEVLDASNNDFSGEIPEVTHSLRKLDLSSNMFTSSKNVCSNATSGRLESLVLPNNKVTGKFLSSVLQCHRLEMLDLSFNSLTGELPYELCQNLPSLVNLLLWGNELQGHIPSTLGDCSRLSILFLSFNRLEGTIPPELSKLSKLDWLTLGSNRLTGEIPPSFGDLKNLRVLQLYNNSLQGHIPTELEKSSDLLILQLSNNFLSGPIPSRIGRDHAGLVQISSVNGMSIVGTRDPECAGSPFVLQGIPLNVFKKLVNSRSGCTAASFNFQPFYLWNVSTLVLIDVSYNRLSGEVPAEIGDSMKSLTTFRASHNLLTGKIPESLGNLEALAILDLAQNSLQGSIPASFSQLNGISVFNVSYNGLSGLIPQSGQISTFPASSFEGNPGLCGLPLPSSCNESSTGLAGESRHEGTDDVEIIGALVIGSASFAVCFWLAFSKTEKHLLRIVF